MEPPERIEEPSLANYLEVMSKSVFQPGMSWRVVEAKWPGIREAYHSFDPVAVAQFTDGDVDDLATDKSVIRNRRKLDAVVANARRILELDETHGTFRGYLRSHGGFEETVTDLRKQFRFVGDMGAYHFLYVVNEEVPSYEAWCASRGRDPKTSG
jgi:DNA-3-methyladenine glycosylase I